MSINILTIFLQALFLTILGITYIAVKKRRFVPTVLIVEHENGSSTAFSRILLKTFANHHQLTIPSLVSTRYLRFSNSVIKAVCISPNQVDSVLSSSLYDIYLPHVMLIIYVIDSTDLHVSLKDVLKLLEAPSIGCDIIVSTPSKDMESLQTRLAPLIFGYIPEEASRIIYVIGNPQNGWQELLEATWKHA